MTDDPIAPLEPEAADHIGAVPALTFTSEMRLLANRFLWWDLCRVTFLSTLGLYVAVFLASLWADPSDPVLLPVIVAPIAAGGLLALMIVACLIMGNRWTYTVGIGSDGIGWSVGQRERRINRIAGAINVMSGRPGNIGASAIAISQEDDGMTWDEVRRANYHDAARVISLRDSWHVVQRLYVPEESWVQAVGAVQRGIAEGERLRAQQTTSAAASPVWRRNPLVVAASCLVVVVATLAAEVWDLVPDGARGPAIFAGALVLLAVIFEGPLRRIVAALGAFAVVWFLVLVAEEALTPFPSFFTGASTPTWVLDTPRLVVSLVGGAVLLVVAGVRLFGPAKRAGRAATAP